MKKYFLFLTFALLAAQPQANAGHIKNFNALKKAMVNKQLSPEFLSVAIVEPHIKTEDLENMNSLLEKKLYTEFFNLYFKEHAGKVLHTLIGEGGSLGKDWPKLNLNIKIIDSDKIADIKNAETTYTVTITACGQENAVKNYKDWNNKIKNIASENTIMFFSNPNDYGYLMFEDNEFPTFDKNFSENALFIANTDHPTLKFTKKQLESGSLPSQMSINAGWNMILAQPISINGLNISQRMSGNSLTAPFMARIVLCLIAYGCRDVLKHLKNHIYAVYPKIIDSSNVRSEEVTFIAQKIPMGQNSDSQLLNALESQPKKFSRGQLLRYVAKLLPELFQAEWLDNFKQLFKNSKSSIKGKYIFFDDKSSNEINNFVTEYRKYLTTSFYDSEVQNFNTLLSDFGTTPPKLIGEYAARHVKNKEIAAIFWRSLSPQSQHYCDFLKTSSEADQKKLLKIPKIKGILLSKMENFELLNKEYFEDKEFMQEILVLKTTIEKQIDKLLVLKLFIKAMQHEHEHGLLADAKKKLLKLYDKELENSFTFLSLKLNPIPHFNNSKNVEVFIKNQITIIKSFYENIIMRLTDIYDLSSKEIMREGLKKVCLIDLGGLKNDPDVKFDLAEIDQNLYFRIMNFFGNSISHIKSIIDFTRAKIDGVESQTNANFFDSNQATLGKHTDYLLSFYTEKENSLPKEHKNLLDDKQVLNFAKHTAGFLKDKLATLQALSPSVWLDYKQFLKDCEKDTPTVNHKKPSRASEVVHSKPKRFTITGKTTKRLNILKAEW